MPTKAFEKNTAGAALERDVSRSRRGPVIPAPAGKTRITIYVDNDVLERFRADAEAAGEGYQTRINRALRREAFGDPVVEDIRKVVRTELRAIVGLEGKHGALLGRTSSAPGKKR